MGRRVSYNPKNKGKRSCQLIPTFVAGTREFAAADCARVISNLPESAKKIRARADSGFYCCNAVKAYEGKGFEFVLVARKTPRPGRSPRTRTQI